MTDEINNLHFDEYKQLSELYKFYLELVLKTLTFALGIAGAVAAFALSKDNNSLSIYGLIIPSLLCTGLGIGFLINIYNAKELQKSLSKLQRELALKLVPHTKILIHSLRWFGLLLIVIGLGLLLCVFLIR